MNHALARAYARAIEIQRGRSTTPVPTPRAEPVRQGVARRVAATVPYSPRPISVLAPHTETATEVHEAVEAIFREAQAKRKRRAA